VKSENDQNGSLLHSVTSFFSLKEACNTSPSTIVTVPLPLKKTEREGGRKKERLPVLVQCTVCTVAAADGGRRSTKDPRADGVCSADGGLMDATGDACVRDSTDEDGGRRRRL